ncbi:ABC transporter ATP-binding protein [Xanthobacter oligotrophicus]|uniref:ABC transporter ATP-binding protein n=1 Tax=Xanthobacter oligotrophicus TaxID=2607286 RepID=UPI001E330925|nr:ABC transporter ATP-binding protein [Xanthobacter oligotrophicus]MCG5234708.1 ABC transporter ATP-binding protein [Xanthobacter oligotrophicus]
MIRAEPKEIQRMVQGQGFLSLRGLTRRYDHFTAVDDLNLDVARGELIAFLGPSGCGKTTSLRMIAGLVPSTSGHIVVDGRDLTGVPPYRRDMGLVFQSYALFPHMDILKNVAFGLDMRKVPKKVALERAREAIAMVRLSGREHHRPAQLSGGQQQRVALARALVVRPSILLLDEPLSNLDAQLRDEMRTEIRDIQKRLGITAIFVTHDQMEALTICDKVAVMNHGRLEQLGTPHEIYEHPRTAFVAGFVGRINRLSGRASGGIAQAAGTTFAAPGFEGEVEVMVRPHRIGLQAGTSPSDASLHQLGGTIVRATFAGDILEYEVAAGGTVIKTEASTRGGEALLAPGTPVTLSWRPQDTFVYAAS